jgi:pimeloyl-ACP methyl ester carboxylesterase
MPVFDVVEHGQGPVVVLLHGFGEDRSVFDLLVPALAQEHTVVLPHLPGTGKAQWAEEKADEDFSIQDMADYLWALVQAKSWSKICLLGHSMGGYTALAFAKDHPETLSGFGLLHSTAYADSEEKKANRLRGIGLIQIHGGTAFLRITIPNLLGEKAKKENPQALDNLILSAAQFSDSSLVRYYHAMRQRPDTSSVLAALDCPVLIMAGTEDVAVALADLSAQSQLVKNVYFHVLEGVGHMGMLESPLSFQNKLLAFLHQVNHA